MTRTDLAHALDQLAHAAAHPQDPGRATTVLAAAVVDLERAAGAGLGAADGDALVLLQRRLGRLHGLLLAGAGGVEAARVWAYVDALYGAPAAEPVRCCPDTPRSRLVRISAATM